jgi:hypothetical protein
MGYNSTDEYGKDRILKMTSVAYSSILLADNIKWD